MRKILIFEPFLSGHRLEYIHHLHEEAVKNSGTQYYFAVSAQFAEVKENYIWSEADNITFLFLDHRQIQSLQQKSKTVRISGLAGIASKLAKQYKVDETFFISIAEYMPWLPLFFRSRSSISGIIYYIYLYEWKSKKIVGRIKDALTLLSVIPFKKYKHIFLLNDPVAATYMNKKFKTKKFHYLPDPYPPLAVNKEKEVNIKESLGIDDKKKIFLHFGSMSYRKGTLNILHAITSLSGGELGNCCFIFAGKVGDDIKERFYNLIDILKDKVQILVFDEFCPPPLLSSLCKICSAILAPYYNTAYSSGIVGYAANFHTPIVVPNEKFIGKLVRRYHLGYLLKDNSAKSIAGFIKDSDTFLTINGNRYMVTHTVDAFAQHTLLFEK